VAWQRELDEAPRDHALAGVAVRGARAVVAATVDARLLVWRVGATGPATPQVVATLAPGVHVDGDGAARGLALRSDDAALVLVRAGGVAWLVGVGADGAVVLARPVGDRAAGRDVDRLVAWPDGGLVLLGREGDAAWALRTTAAGTPRWDRSEERGRPARYRDAAPAAEGGAVLVGETAGGDEAPAVFATAVDATGARGPTVAFPGRRPRAAATSRGTAVVYERDVAGGVALALRMLDERLATALDADLETRPDERANALDAIAVPARGRELLVVGTWGARPVVLRVDARGRVRSRRWPLPGVARPGVPEAAATADGAVVAYPVPVTRAGWPPHRALVVLRLGLRDPR
jgi:hypothetical protein